jgi:hypothetical protein
MAIRYLGSPATEPRERASLVTPIIVLWTIVVSAILAFVWIDNDLSTLMPELYLLPWTFLAAICVLAPTFYLYWSGQFDLFHPLVFAAWSHVFPAYVVGGLLFAIGWGNYFFLNFIDDPEYYLPLTLLYVSIGFVGLTIGYFIPLGRFLGTLIDRRLPEWNWRPDQVWLPGILLLLAGVAFNIIGFIQGLVGYQKNIDVGSFDGLIFALVTLLGEGTLLLWLAVFGARKRDVKFYVVLFVLIAFLPIRMAVLGSRASLIIGLLPIAMAYLYSGHKLRFRTAAIFGVVGVLAVFIGAIYGTTFRNIKGAEARMEAGEYFNHGLMTVEYLSNEDPLDVAQRGVEAVAGRVENLSAVAVTVANYEKLAPYEASYGLDNNIINDMYTAFVPRFVWPDKPHTSDPRAYSALYFNYGENSFPISPFGDLLRNFGSIGVPIGMMFLGIYLRLLYTALIATPFPAMWKKVAYFPLLTIVSYEGFFAVIFPSVLRLIFILAISLWIVNLLVFDKRRAARAG